LEEALQCQPDQFLSRMGSERRILVWLWGLKVELCSLEVASVTTTVPNRLLVFAM
jgi:hypothetical protein